MEAPMRWLLAVLFLSNACAAGAESTRLQVTATILSRCQVALSRVECNAADGSIPYRVRTLGGVLTIEP
jgi:hypothetical protein